MAVFDWDNTLAESKTVLVYSVNQVAVKRLLVKTVSLNKKSTFYGIIEISINPF